MLLYRSVCREKSVLGEVSRIPLACVILNGLRFISIQRHGLEVVVEVLQLRILKILRVEAHCQFLHHFLGSVHLIGIGYKAKITG